MKSKPEIADDGTAPEGDSRYGADVRAEAISQELSRQVHDLQPHDRDPLVGQASSATRASGVPPLIWATSKLLASAMPRSEIRAILRTDDPDVVRRHMELHLERMDEQHAERRRSLSRAGRLLSLNSARRMTR